LPRLQTGSLYNIKRLLEEETFREETVKRLKKENHTRLAQEIEKYIGNFELVVNTDKNGNEISKDMK
jgi:hypothetical protein